MDVTTAPRGELLRLVYELLDKVEALEAENAHLRERLCQKQTGSGPTNQLPSFVKPNTPKKKTKSRKQRDQSYHRMADVPTVRVFHAQKHCSDCGRKLGKPIVAYTRKVIDLPVRPYTVTEHVVCRQWCYHCQRQVLTPVNWKELVLGKGRIGLGLASTIAVLRERCRLPIGVIQTYLRLVYHLTLSRGEIVELLHQVATIGKPLYDRLLQEIRASPVVHGDETGGRENGRNGYFWSFSTPTTHYLLYRQSRGQKIVEEIVGPNSEHFQGTMVSDFYASYNTYTGFHQRCWVHLLRDIRELKHQHPKHPPLNKWAKRVTTIYEAAKAWPGPDASLPIGLAAQTRRQQQQHYEQQLSGLCKPYLTKDRLVSTLCGRICTFLPELFVFVRYPEVPSHNNPAEKILRHTVIARKIQGGTRSAKGSETKAVLTSLFDTWHLRGLNPLQQCQLLLAER